MGAEHRCGAWPLIGAGRQNAYKEGILTRRNRKHEFSCQLVCRLGDRKMSNASIFLRKFGLKLGGAELRLEKRAEIQITGLEGGTPHGLGQHSRTVGHRRVPI